MVRAASEARTDGAPPQNSRKEHYSHEDSSDERRGLAHFLFALSSHAATPAEQLEQLRVEAQSGAASKLTSTFLALKDLPSTVGLASARTRELSYETALGIRSGYVLVTAYGPDPQALRVALEAKGLIRAKVHATSVSGRAPVCGEFEHQAAVGS